MNGMTKEEAAAHISDRLEVAQAIIRECETVADLHNIDFSWEIEYGMGGRYDGTTGEWNASSQSC